MTGHEQPTQREIIDAFLTEGNRIALVGASTDPEHFSRTVMRALMKANYDVVPVHPGVDEIDGRYAYDRVGDVPGGVDGALIMTPATVSAVVVKDCIDAGVPRVWLHRGGGRGADSDLAIQLCIDHDVPVVMGQCPLMFLEPLGFIHRVHRFGKKLAGNYPR